MFRVAFSTVACPDWTLEDVARNAEEYGYDGVELRTFDDGGSPLGCDPALTDPAKTLSIFGSHGVALAGVATGVRMDLAPTPPLLLRAPGIPPFFAESQSDTEREVRMAKRAMGLARSLRAPAVRVFAFEIAPGANEKKVRARIVERLKMAADDARHSGARIALENGGSFPRASDVRSLIREVGSPLLGCCYSAAASAAAGEDVESAVDGLLTGDDLLMVRLKDHKAGVPCGLGEGDVPCRRLVELLARKNYSGWVVYEWDKLWLPELAGPEHALPRAVKTLYEWAGGAHRESRTAAYAAV